MFFICPVDPTQTATPFFVIFPLSSPFRRLLCFREGLIAESGYRSARRHLSIRYRNKIVPLLEGLCGAITWQDP
jgi:hypothetical protein